MGATDSGTVALVIVTLAMLFMSYVFRQIGSDLLSIIAFGFGVLFELMVAGKAFSSGK